MPSRAGGDTPLLPGAVEIIVTTKLLSSHADTGDATLEGPQGSPGVRVLKLLTASLYCSHLQLRVQPWEKAHHGGRGVAGVGRSSQIPPCASRSRFISHGAEPQLLSCGVCPVCFIRLKPTILNRHAENSCRNQ